MTPFAREKTSLPSPTDPSIFREWVHDVALDEQIVPFTLLRKVDAVMTMHAPRVRKQDLLELGNVLQRLLNRIHRYRRLAAESHGLQGKLGLQSLSSRQGTHPD